ncbi:hypothetical protein OAB57_01405 [Bacteriovoracaceae bacterium]|nr:hypothetical protein [Bacteriovoracaceae bacterium]
MFSYNSKFTYSIVCYLLVWNVYATSPKTEKKIRRSSVGKNMPCIDSYLKIDNNCRCKKKKSCLDATKIPGLNKDIGKMVQESINFLNKEKFTKKEYKNLIRKRGLLFKGLKRLYQGKSKKYMEKNSKLVSSKIQSELKNISKSPSNKKEYDSIWNRFSGKSNRKKSSMKNLFSDFNFSNIKTKVTNLFSGSSTLSKNAKKQNAKVPNESFGERSINRRYKRDYNYTSIIKSSNSNIFEIISVRYQKSLHNLIRSSDF